MAESTETQGWFAVFSYKSGARALKSTQCLQPPLLLTHTLDVTLASICILTLHSKRLLLLSVGKALHHSDQVIHMSNADTFNGAENLRVIQRLYDSFARGDGPGALAEMHDNVHWNEAENFIYSDRNPYQSPSDIANGVFGRLLADWEGYEATAHDLLHAGDTIIALGRSKGTNRATRKPLDAQFAHIWRLRKGKIIGFQQYIDTLQVHRATLIT